MNDAYRHEVIASALEFITCGDYAEFRDWWLECHDCEPPDEEYVDALWKLERDKANFPPYKLSTVTTEQVEIIDSRVDELQIVRFDPETGDILQIEEESP